MAVLVEGISVIVRRDAIDRTYPGGWVEYCADAPNRTLCTDDEIVRIGFLDPQHVGEYITRLEAAGLIFIENEKAVDIAVADQQFGFTTECDWLEFGKFPWGDNDETLSACWLFDEPRAGWGLHVRGSSIQIATPPGWEYEGSLSQQFKFVPNS